MNLCITNTSLPMLILGRTKINRFAWHSKKPRSLFGLFRNLSCVISFEGHLVIFCGSYEALKLNAQSRRGRRISHRNKSRNRTNEHQRFSPSRPLSSDFSATSRAIGTGDPPSAFISFRRDERDGFYFQIHPRRRRTRERGIYSASTCEVVRRWKTFVLAGGRELKRRERRAPFAKRVDLCARNNVAPFHEINHDY